MNISSATPVPYTIISAGLCRARVNSRTGQRVISLVDCSGSMGDNNKDQEAFDALSTLHNSLALPVNRNAFETAVIHTASYAKVVHPFEKATCLVSHLQPLVAGSLGGQTNITAGLELAQQLLEEAARQPAITGQSYVRPVTLVMSDGMHNTGPEPYAVANTLKQVCDVLTVGFGDDADETLLRAIATDQCFVRCRTGLELRGYFAQIGQTLTVTRAAGQRVTVALLRPRQ